MEVEHSLEEKNRIQALHELEILDTPPEERFDRITKIAQIMFDVPIALVSLVDSNRQWFKSCAGLSARETPRSMSFCSHAILNEDIMTIEDATTDNRFSDNPLVTGDPFIRFYAGKPIRGQDNRMLGTLCIIDKKPRVFSKADKSVLTDLANWVENEFKTSILTKSLKNTTENLVKVQQELLDQNKNLELKIKEKTNQILKQDRVTTVASMSSRLAHDLRNPLQVIQISSELLRQELEKHMDENMKKRCGNLQSSILEINRIIEDVLEFVKTSQLNQETNSSKNLLENCISNIVIPENIAISLPENDVQIFGDARKIQAVFSNLIINGIQAINGSGEILIRISEYPEKTSITFEDSGPGIPDEVMPKIFEYLYTTKQDGTGLGLGICKSIIEQHGGKISVSNNPTAFTIELPKH
ncbi:GAF domain-containing sensor histidine kinase [Nitrosopumilus adriaticus]|uniref:ATPase/histidine kinase/DNA gyrase B/HSP90 domain protein n=1 Tax=Nitrosopumilus adriaticus TaxID=1580092 RepID=A0A0D5C459_9ARCH|nr:GAF domain-containing sensor histidine kinase [Nitrosopumilus adriaticus]AJW71491.1 ATPase/histidine kinase/DNA gyrase B/HSP90 domain protein [Nitrosopumilus adriaticus]